MYGFYSHFNNPRFDKSQNIDDSSAANVGISFVSSEHLKCRLLRLLSDHPMNSKSSGWTKTWLYGQLLRASLACE